MWSYFMRKFSEAGAFTLSDGRAIGILLGDRHLVFLELPLNHQLVVVIEFAQKMLSVNQRPS